MVRPVTRALGSTRTLQAGLLLNGLGLLVLAVAESWAVLVPALALLTVGQGLVTPSLSLVVTGRVPDHQRGEALGFQQGISAVARVIGPVMAGVLFEHVAIPAPYLVGAGLCTVALVVMLGQPGGSRKRTLGAADVPVTN